MVKYSSPKRLLSVQFWLTPFCPCRLDGQGYSAFNRKIVGSNPTKGIIRVWFNGRILRLHRSDGDSISSTRNWAYSVTRIAHRTSDSEVKIQILLSSFWGYGVMDKHKKLLTFCSRFDSE